MIIKCNYGSPENGYQPTAIILGADKQIRRFDFTQRYEQSDPTQPQHLTYYFSAYFSPDWPQSLTIASNTNKDELDRVAEYFIGLYRDDILGISVHESFVDITTSLQVPSNIGGDNNDN